ncbi:TolC family outer membrane protein [Candidatus Methylobacter oryzae]|uniref:TolC family outer membrane protein n=1 Tax=Candidatus Methylobacter oryzae TaxID=2497749 RepID=A0ABY3CBU4_9GAMM|nr:TolC family outer membrane protein [Candidatus Methylobacter oryzae]TRW97085.1 TolC family outer membrane protein [Candidatus Methylobacter oryzae]
MSSSRVKRTAAHYLPGFIVICCTAVAQMAHAQDLMDVYELALQNDPALKQAQANWLAVGESKNQSIANFLPTVSATALSNLNRLSNKRFTYQGVGVQNYADNNFTLNLSQPLFHWDHWVQLSQSDNQIAQAEADYQAELQKLIVKITEAYFNVLSAEDNLEFSRSEKQAIARQLEQAKQQFAVGLIDITESRQAQAAFDRASADEIAASNSVDDQKEALAEIIGEQDLKLNRLGESLPLARPEPDDMTEWSNSAEAGNFSIIAAFNQMEFSRKGIDLQRNGHLPKLDLTASLGEYDTSSQFGLRGSTEMVGVRLNVPLYEGGAVTSRTQQARYRYEQAKEQLTAAKRAVNRQVKDAYRGITTSLGRVEALKTAVASAEVALQATEAGFEVGVRTLVEVLNEQRNLYLAKRDYSRTRYDYLLNSIKLKQAASSLSQEDIEKINRLLVTSSAAVKVEK